MTALRVAILGIAVLSLCPQAIPVFSVPDWIGHGLAYGLLTVLARRHWPDHASLAALGVFALGAVLELVQLATPDRSASLGDLAANGMGIALVVLWQSRTRFLLTASALSLSGCAALPVPGNVDRVKLAEGYQFEQQAMPATPGDPLPFAGRTEAALDRCAPHRDYDRYPLMPRQKAHGALSSGDLIRVLVEGDGLLSGDYEIEGDGALHLPHLAPIRASGRSPAMVARALRNALLTEKLYRAPLPAVAVQPMERAAVRIHVGGAVFEPGTVDIAARTPEDRDQVRQLASGDAAHRYGLTAALRAAAGVRPDAEMQRVLVKRGDRVWRVDLLNAAKNGAFHDPMLQPGDHVLVPSLGCFQSGLARPTVVTRKGVKVHLSNLTVPAFSNAQSAIDDDVRELRYGTRLLQVLVRMNCVGGTHTTNASRWAIHISRNPVTGETEVIERSIEDLVRRADRASHDPVMMPGDAVACYDSNVTNARDMARSFIDVLSPVPFSRGL